MSSNDFKRHKITLTKDEYSLLLMCVYDKSIQYEKKLERIIDKRESLGYFKRIGELDALKETLIGWETE